MTSRGITRIYRGRLARHATTTRMKLLRAEVRLARQATRHVRTALAVAVARGDHLAERLRGTREELEYQYAARQAAEQRVAELETPKGVTGAQLADLRDLATRSAT